MSGMRKIKILFVDDEEMLRIYFRDVFWIHGLDSKYELYTASNSKEAEKILMDPETRPHIVFLDLVMPMEKEGHIVKTHEAGFGILKKIKQTKELKDIKVIVFSGHAEDVFREEAKKLGADNYVIKGDNLPKELIEFVEKIASTIK